MKIDGHVGGADKIKHREFAMASGEMSQDQFTRFLTEILGNLADASCDGSIHFVGMDWRHMSELMAAGGRVYGEIFRPDRLDQDQRRHGDLLSLAPRADLRLQEGHLGPHQHLRARRAGRYRTNVWEYPGINTFRNDRDDELAMHPTVKPVALVADAIKDVSRRGHIVLDGFGGSGTTLIAAQKTARKARLLELDPAYCDVICRRFEAYTGKPAILAESGLPWAEVVDLRAGAGACGGNVTRAGMTGSTALGGPGFSLCSAAAPTAPGEAVFALGPGLEAQGSSGACERQHRAHSGPTGAA